MHVAELCPNCRTEISQTLLPVNFFQCPKCGLTADRTTLVRTKLSRWALAGQNPAAAVTPLAPGIDTVTDWSFVLQGAAQDTTGDVAVGPTVANSAILCSLAWDANVNLSTFVYNAVSITPTIQVPIVGSNALVAVVPRTATSMTFNATFDGPASWIAFYACQVKPATGMGQVVLDKTNYGVNGTDPSRSSYTTTTTQANELIAGVLVTEGPVSDTQPTWDSPFVQANRVGTAFSPAGSNNTIAVAQYKTTSTGTFRSGAATLSGRPTLIWVGTFK